MVLSKQEVVRVAPSQEMQDTTTFSFNGNSQPFGYFSGVNTLNSQGLLKPECLFGSPGDNYSCTSSSSTPIMSMTYPQFPFVEKSPPNRISEEANIVKGKLLAALRDIIPHKTSLTLRLLVSYTIDNGNSDVIVIDETLQRKSTESSGYSTVGNVLDLSLKSEDSMQYSDLPLDPNWMALLQKTAIPMLNAATSRLAPPSVIRPLNASPPPPPLLNPEMLNPYLMIQTLLNGGNQTPISLLNFQTPTSFANPASIDFKPEHLSEEIASDSTTGNAASILQNFPLCANAQSLVTQAIDSRSRSSSPISNHGGFLTSHTFKKMEKPSTSGAQSTFNRRFMHPRRFVCNQCRKQFPSLAELNRHTLELHNSFRCNFCKAKFTQRSNLQRHSLKHVGFRPFTCNICRKEYYRKDHLVRHIEVTHPNVDPRANITTRLTSSECLDFLDNFYAYDNSESASDEVDVSGQLGSSADPTPPSLELEENSGPNESPLEICEVNSAVDESFSQKSPANPGNNYEMVEPV